MLHLWPIDTMYSMAVSTGTYMTLTGMTIPANGKGMATENLLLFAPNLLYGLTFTGIAIYVIW